MKVNLRWSILGALVCGSIGTSYAMTDHFHQSFAGYKVVSMHKLDKMRGGFSVPGFQVSFGISQATWVNGQLVAAQQLIWNPNSPGGASIRSPGAASMTVSAGPLPPTPASQAGTVLPSQLIQVASNGQISVSTVNAPSAIATIVQNNMSGAAILHSLNINATITGLRQMIQQQNLVGALNQMVATSVH